MKFTNQIASSKQVEQTLEVSAFQRQIANHRLEGRRQGHFVDGGRIAGASDASISRVEVRGRGRRGHIVALAKELQSDRSSNRPQPEETHVRLVVHYVRPRGAVLDLLELLLHALGIAHQADSTRPGRSRRFQRLQGRHRAD